MTKRFLISLLVLSALALADRAEAQWRAERPYRGLFAGGIGQTTQRLTATASAGTGWSDNLVADPTGGESFLPNQAGNQFKGGVYSGSAVLSYSLNLGGIGLGATAGTTGHYYAANTKQFVRREYASLGASVPIWRGVTVNGSVAYQPYSLRSMFPGIYETSFVDPVIVDEDYPSSTVHYLSYAASTGYSRRISRRMSIQTGYSFQARPAVTGGAEGFVSHSVSGRLTRDLGRGIGGHVGYGYSRALYSQSDPFTFHTIDVGVDYSRAFSISLSRRTTISFSSGTALYQTVTPKTFQFRVTGSARLNHEMGRTWNAGLAYNRGLGFSDTWMQPVFTDSLSAGAGGFINRRTQLRGGAGLVFGAGTVGSYGDILGVSGGSSLSFAVTRHLNTALTYSYYRQRFASTLALVEGFPQDYDGQSIRVSVSVWAPLFQRPRRP